MSDAPAKDAPTPSPPGVKTAADLMTANPVSLRDDATLDEAIAFLSDTGYSAAPVIDASGRPVGVLSRSDIVAHDRTRAALPASAPLYFEQADRTAGEARPAPAQAARVRNLMTPAVFAVAPQTPAGKVAEQMVELNVHRLFVVDRDGVLVGVVSALDLLRHLRQ